MLADIEPIHGDTWSANDIKKMGEAVRINEDIMLCTVQGGNRITGEI